MASIEEVKQLLMSTMETLDAVSGATMEIGDVELQGAIATLNVATEGSNNQSLIEASGQIAQAQLLIMDAARAIQGAKQSIEDGMRGL